MQQTLEGKVVAGVVRLAKNSKVPVLIITGQAAALVLDSSLLKAVPVYQLVDVAKSSEDAILNAASHLNNLSERSVRDFLQS